MYIKIAGSSAASFNIIPRWYSQNHSPISCSERALIGAGSWNTVT